MFNKNKKTIRFISILLVSIFMLTGCDSGKDKLKIGHLGKEGNLLYYLAEDLGFFKEEGISAELVEFASSEEGIEAILNGEIDTGGFRNMPGLLKIDAGADLKIHGGGMQHGYAMLTLEENDKKYNFLKNYLDKRIGVTKESMEEVLLRAGLDELRFEIGKDLEVIEYDSSSEVVAAIKSGEVDSGLLCIDDLNTEERSGLREAIGSVEFIEKHPAYGQMAKASIVEDEDNHELLVRLNRALIKAYKHYLENPEETVDILAKYIDRPKDELMADIYDEEMQPDWDRFWPNPNPNRAYNWKFLQGLELSGYLESDKDIKNDFVYQDGYLDAMNQLADETGDPVYRELQSQHVC